MSDRTHRSIGEVLHLLEDEFPEVTISKIRFLESQGLLNPERTPSGYRMFFNEDIGRLKWILVQQRDNFLPLRVIKKRLDNNEWSPEEFAIADVPVEADTFARNVEATTPAPAGVPVAAVATVPSATTVEDVAARLQAAAPAADVPESAPTAPAPVAAAETAAPPVEEAAPVQVDDATEGDSQVTEAPAAAVAEAPAPVAAPTLVPVADPPERSPAPVQATPIEQQPAPVPVAPVEKAPAVAPQAAPPAQPAPVPVAPVEQAPAVAPPAAPPAEPAPVRAQPAATPPPAEVPQQPAAAVQAAPVERAVQHSSTMLPLHPPRSDAFDPAPVLATSEPPPTHALQSTAADVTFNTTELAEAAGIDVVTVRELQKFGIVEAIVEEPPTFDADSLMIARAAAAFMSHGLEPRHLKPFRIAAEREAGMLEQLTLPVARQKSAGASRRAVDLANELVSMGSDLRYAMLRRSLRTTLELD